MHAEEWNIYRRVPTIIRAHVVDKVVFSHSSSKQKQAQNGNCSDCLHHFLFSSWKPVENWLPLYLLTWYPVQYKAPQLQVALNRV